MFGDCKKVKEENILLKKQMQEAMILLERQSQEIRKTHSEISTLRTENNQLKTSINPEIETSINNKDEEIRFLREDNGKMVSEIQSLQNKNDILLDENRRLTESAQQNAHGIDIIEIDLKKQIEFLKQKLEDVKKEKSQAYISLERQYMTSSILLKESLNKLEITIQALNESQNIGKVISQADAFSKKVRGIFKKPKKDTIKKTSSPIIEDYKNVKNHTEKIDTLNKQILNERSRGINAVKHLVDIKG